MVSPRTWWRSRRRHDHRTLPARYAGHATGIRPIFIGGTGRSGTTIIGRLLGRHRAIWGVPTETRFIVSPDGLCAILEGRARLWPFERRVLQRWYDRGPRKGLHLFLAPDEIREAAAELRRGFADPWAASARFTHRLLDPPAIAKGANAWAEMSPGSTMFAPSMLRMFPDMKLIHMVRDGRDVACSVVPFAWGPNDLDEALDWWATRLEASFQACDAIPADRVLVLRMEDILARARDREYARVLGFLEVEDDPEMREWFEREVTAQRAHVGRWQQDVPAERRAAFDAHYRRLADELAARGRPYLDEVLEPA